ncbi:Macrophage infectivity potentiator-related protein [Candidatus Burkholderia verschuerenii]|uniref:Macrophage infectivity potentiator-related protein n=1 Tax=Candidatus Burkholderia verschuerenii TaxID=242163 RepID=A0A0L0MC03_9BURK|nr:carboxymuconolactone decarboxylase family protein [Candidatus Burkholderia verschuerenii]KND60237.1 Macrophage infectivity potentiator-related protein [Candidatus Burkholderia verschuerenii]
MSRLSQLDINEATGVTAELFSTIKRAAGRVPNAYAAIGTHSPAALGAAMAGDAVLAKSTLSKADVEAVKLAVSELAGCDYCAAAHTAVGKMVGLTQAQTQQIRAGEATGDAKRDALVRFVRTLASTRGTLDERKLNTVREAGYTDAQITDALFAMSVINFTNLFNRVNDTTIDFPALV